MARRPPAGDAGHLRARLAYAYFQAFEGQLAVRTLRANSGERGTFCEGDGSLGVWTNVAGNHNRFLVTGEGPTTFRTPSAAEVVVDNAANALTVSLLPDEAPATCRDFAARARAHILGIQGLPANPLILHVGLHADYMADYVALGLSESPNRRPSGLPDGEWRDLWWNLWALLDPDAALADYSQHGEYTPEEGETRAHTYHWLHAMRGLGQVRTGTGALTADHPAAMAFERDGVMRYVVYNFGAEPLDVTFSDGQVVRAGPGQLAVSTGD